MLQLTLATKHSDATYPMPWQKSYDETEVLTRAMEAFWSKGYSATSISDLTRATGLNRGSLYSEFIDKRTLYLRALRFYDRHYRREWLATFRQRYPPEEAVGALFDSVAGRVALENRRNGCLVVNTAVEMAPFDPEVAVIVNRAFAEIEEFFLDCVQDGQAAGTVVKSLDARKIAKQLKAMLLGVWLLSRAQSSPEDLYDLADRAKALLDPSRDSH